MQSVSIEDSQGKSRQIHLYITEILQKIQGTKILDGIHNEKKIFEGTFTLF